MQNLLCLFYHNILLNKDFLLYIFSEVTEESSQHILDFPYTEKMFPHASHFSVNVPFRFLIILIVNLAKYGKINHVNKDNRYC